MPHRIIDPLEVANMRATSRIVCAGMPQTGAIFSGKTAWHSRAGLHNPGAVTYEILVHEAFVDDCVDHCIQERDIGVRVELQEMRRMPGEFGPARVGDDQLHAVLCAFFIQVAATGGSRWGWRQ